jgi:hypothetical protein
LLLDLGEAPVNGVRHRRAQCQCNSWSCPRSALKTNPKTVRNRVSTASQRENLNPCQLRS